MNARARRRRPHAFAIRARRLSRRGTVTALASAASNLTGRSLEKAVTVSLRAQFTDKAKKDLDKGIVWKFKTARTRDRTRDLSKHTDAAHVPGVFEPWAGQFTLFPILIRLRYLDFIFRAAFPIAYVIFCLAMAAEVDFGRAHSRLLATAPCYLIASAA